MNQVMNVLSGRMNLEMKKKTGTRSEAVGTLETGIAKETEGRRNFMNTNEIVTEEGTKKRKGRKKKESNEGDQASKEQNKFFIDVSKDAESKEMLLSLLAQVNNKTYGREIILKDLILVALPKLSSKDLEKIQENSLSEMEKVERALDEHNRKSDVKLTLGEFLVRKLGIN
ncbi:MAG: hypothetical protein ACLGG0_09560 [Bacteriovoracia bacterium]